MCFCVGMCKQLISVELEWYNEWVLFFSYVYVSWKPLLFPWWILCVTNPTVSSSHRLTLTLKGFVASRIKWLGTKTVVLVMPARSWLSMQCEKTWPRVLCKQKNEAMGHFSDGMGDANQIPLWHTHWLIFILGQLLHLQVSLYHASACLSIRPEHDKLGPDRKPQSHTHFHDRLRPDMKPLSLSLIAANLYQIWLDEYHEADRYLKGWYMANFYTFCTQLFHDRQGPELTTFRAPKLRWGLMM